MTKKISDLKEELASLPILDFGVYFRSVLMCVVFFFLFISSHLQYYETLLRKRHITQKCKKKIGRFHENFNQKAKSDNTEFVTQTFSGGGGVFKGKG